MEERTPRPRRKPPLGVARFMQAGPGRIRAYSDGVFAIAVTLLILDIKIPEATTNDAELTARLLDLTPQIITYAIAFHIIGRNWMLHYTLFSYIKRVTPNLLYLNNLYLMMIAFQPLPISVISHGLHTPAIIFYDGAQVITNILSGLIWAYASYKHHLIDADINPRFIQRYLVKIVIDMLIFVISIGISYYFDSSWALWSLVFLALDDFTLNRFYPRNGRDRERKKPAKTALPEPPLLPAPTKLVPLKKKKSASLVKKSADKISKS